MVAQAFFQDNIDATKLVDFDVAAVSTATTRVITMPDEDIDLGALATETYVQDIFFAATWKQAVSVATTAAGTLATDFEAGDTVDGVTLTTGMRILIKDQATGSENGIYVVAASGAPVRDQDFSSSLDILNGAATYVQAGATNGDKVFIMTNDTPVNLGVDTPVFAEISGGGGGTTYTGQPGVVFVNGTVIELVDDVTAKTPATNAAIDWDVVADGLFLDITLDGNNTLNLPTNLPAAGTYRSAAIKVTKTNSTDTLTLNGYFSGDSTFEGTGPFLCSVVLENGSGLWRSEAGLATDTSTGVVELATDAEAIAGTDNQRAVTPANLDARDVQLLGIATGEADMGTFTGTTIGDDQDVKTCLQDLETAVENSVQVPVTPEDYTVTNMTSQRTLDCDASTLQNTNDVLGQLINDLITVGILQ